MHIKAQKVEIMILLLCTMVIECIKALNNGNKIRIIYEQWEKHFKNSNRVVLLETQYVLLKINYNFL
jgi:hypothetical protein